MAQDAKLFEAAKKESRQVVVHGSIENDTMDSDRRGVQEEDRALHRLACGTTKVMDRVLGETRTGNRTSS